MFDRKRNAPEYTNIKSFYLWVYESKQTVWGNIPKWIWYVSIFNLGAEAVIKMRVIHFFLFGDCLQFPKCNSKSKPYFFTLWNVCLPLKMSDLCYFVRNEMSVRVDFNPIYYRQIIQRFDIRARTHAQKPNKNVGCHMSTGFDACHWCYIHTW